MWEHTETQLDSNCGRRLPTADTPDAVGPRCKGDASTWVLVRGTRRYLCEDHAREVVRFVDADDVADAVEKHPLARPCDSCRRLTLRDDLSGGTCPDCSDDGESGG